ncbi:MAG TPA: hypothetical protein VFM77_19130 [Terriglobales bacterium]|nr:hypothetical protein [Terriglobales bacterium]
MGGEPIGRRTVLAGFLILLGVVAITTMKAKADPSIEERFQPAKAADKA